MTATELEHPAAVAAPSEPKVNAPHAWAGRMVFYWRVTNQATGELSPLPAMLLEPTRGSDGWTLNFWRYNAMQGRQQVKHSEKPRAGCFTFAAGDKGRK